jgi:hypothetical protein
MQTQLAQARARLSSLIEINQLLMGTVEPDELLRVILEAAIRLFAVEGCSIGLIDETAQQLAFTIMAGKVKVDEFRIAGGQGIPSSGGVAARRVCRCAGCERGAEDEGELTRR